MKRKDIVVAVVILVLAGLVSYEYYALHKYQQFANNVLYKEILDLVSSSRLSSADKNAVIERVTQQWPRLSYGTDFSKSDAAPAGRCDRCDEIRSEFQGAVERCHERGNRYGDCDQARNWSYAFSGWSCYNACGRVGIWD